MSALVYGSREERRPARDFIAEWSSSQSGRFPRILRVRPRLCLRAPHTKVYYSLLHVCQNGTTRHANGVKLVRASLHACPTNTFISKVSRAGEPPADTLRKDASRSSILRRAHPPHYRAPRSMPLQQWTERRKQTRKARPRIRKLSVGHLHLRRGDPDAEPEAKGSRVARGRTTRAHGRVAGVSEDVPQRRGAFGKGPIARRLDARRPGARVRQALARAPRRVR